VDVGGGRCYIHIRRDDVDLTPAIEKRLAKLIETERLDLRIMDEDEDPPDELAPNDLVISGKVTRCDYGSRFVRYWLTFVALMGPGSCRLEVDADVETDEGGVRRVKSSARQSVGFLGGSGPELMKRNVQIVASRIASEAARQATGQRFLNAQAYSCAYWSFGLGLVSVLPFIGIPFGLVAFVLSLVALLTISRRDLPRGKGFAITGVLLPFFGLVVSAAFLLLAWLK